MIFGSIVDFFTGESGRSQNEQHISQNVDTDVSGESSQETASRSTTTGSQETTATTGQQQQTQTRLFSPEEEQALQGVLAGLIQNFQTQGGTVPDTFLNATGEAVNAAGALQSRAGTAEADILGQIQPIVSEARRSGERQIGRARTDLGTVTGSTQDSTAVAATAEAEAALQSQLAALESELTIGARNTQTDEMTRAITAMLGSAQAGGELANLGVTSGVGNITEVANLLRGASAETSSTGQVETREAVTTEQLTEALQNVFNEFDQQTRSRTSGSSTSDTRTTQSGSLLDLLNGIGGLANP